MIFLNTASNLKTIRELKGISQAELGSMIGVSQQMIFQIEKGFRGMSVPMLVEISVALDCTPNDILGFKKNSKTN